MGPLCSGTLSDRCPLRLPGERGHGRNRRRSGERFVSVRATLRGRRLTKRGRTVDVDLRGRAEGAYNVRLSSRYRTRGGKLRIVRSVRTLSVACS